MDSFITILSLLLVIFYCTICTTKAEFYYDVYKYGAVGNGKLDDSQAFTKAWNAACTAIDGTPTMLIPSGIFLLKQTEFLGPCKSNNVNVKVLGKLVAPSKDKWTGDLNTWLLFRHVDGLVIYGSGTIDGQGASWWNNKDEHRPTALHLASCPNAKLSGLKHINSARNHISVSGGRNIEISYIYINAPFDSPNTDGIDIASSNNIHIHDLTIKTGDDCIAINDKSSFINITNVFCGPGHGISVGSLGKGGSYQTVEEVHVFNCTFSGTTNGARIKSWQGGSGYAKNITFENLTFDNAMNPIIIDQMYNPNFMPRKYQGSNVQVSNIRYSNIKGSSNGPKAIDFNCASTGCSNIVLENVHIISSISDQSTYASCTNVQGSTSNVTPKVSCLPQRPI